MSYPISRPSASLLLVLLLAGSCRVETPEAPVEPGQETPAVLERILLGRDRIRFEEARAKRPRPRASLSWSGQTLGSEWSRFLFEGWHTLGSPSLSIERSSQIETIQVRSQTPPDAGPVRLALVWSDRPQLTLRDILTYRRDLLLPPGAGTITLQGDNLADLGMVDPKAVGFLFLLSRLPSHLDFVTGIEIETEQSLLQREPFGFKRRFVNGSLRDSAFIRSGGRIVYETELSGTTNHLLLGLNSLAPGTLHYRIGLAGQSERLVLSSGRVDAFGGWKDLRVRLPRLSGRVRLSLECTSDRPNVIFWGNPMIAGGLGTGSRDHIVLYLMDGLRADHLGVYGYDKPTSPFLDALSQEAIVASGAFSAASWTKPSIASLMTSVYPGRHRVGTTSHMDVLPDEVTTLAETLGAGGYVTASLSANPLATTLSNLDQGFDYVLTPEFFIDPEDWAGKVPSESLTRAVLAWLDDHAETPFFLYVHAMETHTPWTAGLRKDLTNADAEIHAYDSSIRQNDAALERIHRRLLRLERPSLVTILSDHGESLGDHGIRGHGNSLYQEQVRVPLVLSHPEFDTRTEIAQPVDFFDVARTILEFSGVDFDRSGWWGRDLMKPLRERPVFLANQTLPDEITGDASGDRPPMHAVVEYPWKLILTQTTDDSIESELYRLSDDPRELSDRSARHPETVRRLQALLLKHIKMQTDQTGTVPGQFVPSSRDIELLRALGYVD